MEIVVSHSNTDFDALAAQYAVTKLHPGCKLALAYPLSSNIREFITLYRSFLPIVDLQYLDLDLVKHLFVVDCQHSARLDVLARQLLDRRLCSYTVFDHHTSDPQGLLKGARDDSLVQAVGACTTLLVKSLMERGQKLTAFEATLLAIGIYEDSGCLTYDGTTALDASAVAYLLEQGADLLQISNFISPKLDEEQTRLFRSLESNCETVTVCGIKALVAFAESAKYIEGLATMTRRLLEIGSADAAVTVVLMRDRVHVVCRSDCLSANMRDLARTFGGDGHRGAASAVVKKRTVAQVKEDVVQFLRREVEPPISVAEIMRSPVRTIKPEMSMNEAARLMLRYDEDGLVVTEGETISGVVSKRDIEKALHHKLGHAPVKGFMSRPVLTAKVESSLTEVQKIMVKEDIGRVAIVDAQGKLAGIVTRREVLRTLFGGAAVTDDAEMKVVAERRKLHFQSQLESLDGATGWLFREVGIIAQRLNMKAYAVGGCVRDLFLGRLNFDLDFVVEGNAIELARALASAYPGRFALQAVHDRFQTATLAFFGAKRQEIDISTARIEFYEHPAALPVVEASELEQDLFRRDFTVNALAICLDPSEYGEAIDFFNGIADMESKLVRVLHKFSFIEDPTRIIRAARFACRLGFQLELNTRREAERAIAIGVFDNLGDARLKEELKLILEAPSRMKALHLLNELGSGLGYLASDLVYDQQVRAAMRRAERLLLRQQIQDVWIVYLGTMLGALTEDRLEIVMGRLALANEEKQWIRSGVKLPKQLELSADVVRAPRSSIYNLLNGLGDQTLAIAGALASPGSKTRRMIKLYMDELKCVRVFLTGDDLIRIGFPQGPLIKEALARVKEAKLDGQVGTQAQELEFVLKSYPQYSSCS